MKYVVKFFRNRGRYFIIINEISQFGAISEFVSPAYVMIQEGRLPVVTGRHRHKNDLVCFDIKRPGIEFRRLKELRRHFSSCAPPFLSPNHSISRRRARWRISEAWAQRMKGRGRLMMRSLTGPP